MPAPFSVQMYFILFFMTVVFIGKVLPPRWSTGDAVIQTLSAENPKLSETFFCEPGVGQSAAFHASSTAKTSAFLTAASMVH